MDAGIGGCGAMSCSCPTFTLESDSYIVYLHKPERGSVDGSINNTVDVFNFWDDDFAVINRGIETEPLTLRGVELVCGDNVGLCFPLCFPICFSQPLAVKFDTIDSIMNAHEEITISGLGDCIDGVYVISDFSWGPMSGSQAYWWTLSLQYVRSV